MKHIYICASKIEGLGVRAGENIKKGSLITKFSGPIKFKINKNKYDALSHPDWVGIKKDHWMDPKKPQKFFNHSCNPNASVHRKVEIVALRDIQEGEEMTFDYSIIEGDPRWEMECKCGERNCRKVIRSVQFMPKDQFEKYLPYIPAYFKNLYLKDPKHSQFAKA